MVLLVAAGGLVKCAVDNGSPSAPLRESQLLHLARLLLLLEYFMKHLYDAPPVLLDQVSASLLALFREGCA